MALWLLAPLLLSNAALAQDQDDLMEVYWEFRYAGLVNSVVESRYDGERFYMSIGDLFAALQLNVVQDLEAGTASGFFIDTERTYELDFVQGRARFDDEVLHLDSTDFARGPLGFFIRPAVLDSLFGLRLTLDERGLTLSLQTDAEMPVVAAYRRRATRARALTGGRSTLFTPHAPLLYGRDRSLVDGGVLGYRLGLSMEGLRPRANFNFQGGGEVLGGDVEAGVSGTYTITDQGTTLRLTPDRWRWRYVLLDNPFLSQIYAGRISSTGLRPFSYRGLRLTNQPVQVRRFYGTFPVRVVTQPNWEIELYINNRLIDVQTADATGIHTFQVPITYGSTSVTIREYGPSGEFRESEQRIQVPFTFVPRHEIQYSLHAGQTDPDGYLLSQAQAAVGLTDWLTVTGGMDYITADSMRVGEQPGAVGYGSFSARIRGPYVLSGRFAPGASHRLSLNANFPSFLSFSLEYAQYSDNRLYNTSRTLHELRGNVSVPVRISGVPVYLRLNAGERRIDSTRYAINLTPDLSVSIGAFRVNLGYRSNLNVVGGHLQAQTQQLNARLGYSFPLSHGTPTPIRGLLVSARTDYDFLDNSFQGINLGLSRSITRSIRAQLDVAHRFSPGTTTANLRLYLNLSQIRVSTSSTLGADRAPNVSQDISGALSYDGGSGKLGFSQQNWTGRSAATLRLFVDYNGNNERDDEEPFIEHGGVNFRRTVNTQQGSEGFIVAYNLLAYEQYNVSVDESKVRNPLWVPKYEEFSFITDPNSHKVVDIPFYVSGEVEGTILLARNGETQAVPGLKLHIRNAETGRHWEEPVFSDGSFYKIGLPPGRYEAYVDSSQMQVLKAVSDPAVRHFEIAVTERGDFVEGVDFTLRTPAPAGEPADLPTPPVAEAQPPPEKPAPDETPETAYETAETAPVSTAPPGAADGALTEDAATDEPPAEDPASEEPEATPSAEGLTYEISTTDASLMDVARQVYGDGHLWPKLWAANPDVLPNPDRIEPGMRLRIPAEAPLTPYERAARQAYARGMRQLPARPGDAQPDDVPADDAPAETAEEAPPMEDVYVVRPADVSLMDIARQVYGEGHLWPKLWVANRDVLPDPDRIEPGMRLRIPEKAPLTADERAAYLDYLRRP